MSFLEETKVVTAKLEGGREILVEVRTTGDPRAPVGIEDKFDFAGVASSIEAIAESMTKAISRARPTKAAVEFGVDVNVESGALTGLLVKGTGGATLKVTLEWEAGSSPPTRV